MSTVLEDPDPAVRPDTAPAPAGSAVRLRPWSDVLARTGARLVASAPVVAARTAWLLGLLALVDAVGPHRMRGVSLLVLPVPARAVATATVAVAGLMLLRVASGLRRRKRAEWRLAVVTSAALLVADLARDERHPVEALVAGALLLLLVVARHRFTALSDRRSRWFAARVAAQFLLAGAAVGTLLVLWPGHVPAHVSIGRRLVEVLQSLVGLGGGIPLRDDLVADVFHATVLAFGLCGIVVGALLALRSPEPPATLAPEDEQRLRVLLARHGERDSLGYFALRRDKAVLWSDTGKAAVTYRVVSGVALVSGDPLGDPEAWPGAVDAYRRLVERHGWIPAVTGCSELGATVFHREYGLAALALGDESVLDAAGFTLQGRAMRGVRQACARVERAGYTATVRRVADVPPAELEQLRAAAEAWRGEPVERGYSMALSRLGDPADGRCVIVTAHRDGRLHGLLHFVPWGERGISLDLMRRDRGSDNGLNEYLIATTMAACRDLGIDRVSLNFAVFRDALERGDRIGAGPVSRLVRRVLLVASRWWQIDSLYRFNAKFRPQWLPRFICYPTARDLPRVALAALEAEAFVVRPAFVARLLGRG